MNTLLQQLEDIYAGSRATKAAWPNERIELEKLLPMVAEEVSFNYDLVRPLAVGGGGVVFEVEDRNLGVTRALKLARPSPGKERFLAESLTAETDKLTRLAHANLMPVYARGVVTTEEQASPFYVMRFIEGVVDLDDALEKHTLDGHRLIPAIAALVDVISYLHSNDVAHMDLKPANVMLESDGSPLLGDLGFAKDLDLSDGDTMAAGTDGYTHPEYANYLVEASSDPNRNSGPIPRDVVSTYGRVWDLFGLGKTIERLLASQIAQRELDNYTYSYLELMSARLLDGHYDGEAVLGLGRDAIAELSYTTIAEVQFDVLKLLGSVDILELVPELNVFSMKTVQVSTLATTPLTERVSRVVGSKGMLRLKGFTQLGLLDLIYPTAVHTRFEHVLGTYSAVARYLNALYNDPLNPVFKQLMTVEDFETALLAALLHDIGHFPLAHDFEEAVPRLISHERMGSELRSQDDSLRRALATDHEAAPGAAGHSWNTSIERVEAVLSSDIGSCSGHFRDRIIKSLIDGPIDADKLDYLMRDSQVLGLKAGFGIDVERLLRTLTVVVRPGHEGRTFGALGIHEKGKVTAESVAFARYTLYGSVYWHHTYRAIKAMLHFAVWDWLGSTDTKAAISNLTEFVGLLDSQQTSLPLDSGEMPASETLVSGNELEMLRWLADRSGDRSKVVLRRIVDRQLHKRLAVWSHGYAGQQNVWAQMRRFVETQTEKDSGWTHRQTLQERVGSEIISRIGARDSALAENLKKLNHHVPIFLIDMPIPKRAATTGLEYVFEGSRAELRAKRTLSTSRFEDSEVWNILNSQFHQSLANLRLYCEPSVVDLVREAGDRDLLEHAMIEAFRT